jgi:hypothetical protein
VVLAFQGLEERSPPLIGDLKYLNARRLHIVKSLSP